MLLSVVLLCLICFALLFVGIIVGCMLLLLCVCLWLLRLLVCVIGLRLLGFLGLIVVLCVVCFERSGWLFSLSGLICGLFGFAALLIWGCFDFDLF